MRKELFLFKKIGFCLYLLMGFISLWSCNTNQVEKFSDKDIEDGYYLSQTYCKSCHTLPDPALLNKETWSNYVLPKMGELVGFRYLGLNHYVENGNTKILKLAEWNQIIKYYTTQAPQNLPRQASKKINAGTKQFKVEKPSFGIKQPSTTMVNAGSSAKGFYFGDGLTQQLYLISQNSTVVDSIGVQKGISHLQVTDTILLALTMGVLQPSDSKEGKLLAISKLTRKVIVILDSLQRPINATYADLTKDGLDDIVICEFGNNTGQLSWFENKGGRKYLRHTLRPLAGAVKSEVYDFNKDGLPDIIALMAQGDEGIFIYYNLGNNSFKEVRVVQLPPSYGSNYFELADFNRDGYPDIIATNGDNGDYPPILKPYHGIRIYLNDGRNSFKEKLFLPVNGIGKAIPRDFDQDGDLDIASIAYFPDYLHTPEEGFIYWENVGGISFKPSSIYEVNEGRWLTMDAGDIDDDNDIDIVLGNANFFIGNMPENLKKKLNLYSPSVLILRNTLH